MSATMHLLKSDRIAWQASAVAVGAVVILSSPFWGNAVAADKEGNKAAEVIPKFKSMPNETTGIDLIRATGDSDHDFAMMMKRQHQGTLEMAHVELRQGKDPALRNMAKTIIASQTREIKEFDIWLARNKESTDETSKQK